MQPTLPIHLQAGEQDTELELLMTELEFKPKQISMTAVIFCPSSRSFLSFIALASQNYISHSSTQFSDPHVIHHTTPPPCHLNSPNTETHGNSPSWDLEENRFGPKLFLAVYEMFLQQTQMIDHFKCTICPLGNCHLSKNCLILQEL